MWIVDFCLFVCRYCVCFQIVKNWQKIYRCKKQIGKSLQHSGGLVLVCLCVCWVIVYDVVDICCCFGFDMWVDCVWVDWWRYIIRSNHGCLSHFNGKNATTVDVKMKNMKKCNIGVLEMCLLGYIPTCGEEDIWFLNGVCVVCEFYAV